VERIELAQKRGQLYELVKNVINFKSHKTRTINSQYERGPAYQRPNAKYFFKNVLFIMSLNPLQAWTGPEGSRRLRLPDLKTIGT